MPRDLDLLILNLYDSMKKELKVESFFVNFYAE